MPTQVEVFDEGCGNRTLITASKKNNKTISLDIESSCKKIQEVAKSLGSEIAVVDVIRSLKYNLVYGRILSSNSTCTIYIVPCALMRTIWAELELTIRRNAEIKFKH